MIYNIFCGFAGNNTKRMGLKNAKGDSRIVKTMSTEKKRILFFIFMLLAGSMGCLICLVRGGNSDQIYQDIVMEWTAGLSSNKSIEMSLLYILIFAGVLAYGLFYGITERHRSDSKTDSDAGIEGKKLFYALAILVFTRLVLFHSCYQIIILAFLYAVILYLVSPQIAYIGTNIFLLNIYAAAGLYRIYAMCGGVHTANGMIVGLVAFAAALVPLLFTDRRKALLRLGMTDSLLIPATLLLFYGNCYKYGESFYYIDPPAAVKMVVVALMVCFVAEAVRRIRVMWKQADDVRDIITMGSCVCIMAYNRFSGSGAIMSTDLHHPFENIIGYSQVFQLGQVPFRNYIPVSGMYSIIHGAVFDWFGEGGTFANYNITNNMFYLFVVILIMSLLWRQADRADCFLIALIFCVMDYDRVAFILPIMLLLVLPSIVAKKSLWLRLWILTSLFQGLYYPLYGAAVCLSFVPFGLYQAFCYVRTGELRREMRTVGFWLKWGICILLPLFSIPFLAGTLRHMLAMSSQAVLEGGIPRFGQVLPDNFLPYLRDEYEVFRLILYDLFTFMIPAGLIWISFALACKAGGVCMERKRCRVKNPQAACQMISVGIMLTVSYTYTFVRLDIGAIYARSAGPIYAGAVIMMLIVERYIGKYGYRMGIMSLFVLLTAIANHTGVYQIEANAKLMPYVTVPADYIYVVDDEFEKLGKGFIQASTYESVRNVYEQNRSDTLTDSAMGIYPHFGYYYLLGKKGDGVIETTTIKGFEAAQEAVDTAQVCGSTIGADLSPLTNYYLYHWLLTSGEYVWDESMRRFYPNHGRYTAEEIRTLNKDSVLSGDGANYWKYPGSLGESMESLEDIFTDVGIGWDVSAEEKADVVSLSRAVDGDEADWLYLEFDGMEEKFEYTQFDSEEELTKITDSVAKYFMKKNYNPGMRVQIGWTDDDRESHTISCAMNKGKLLIPLGAGVKWLFHEHDSISVSVYQNEEITVIPKINEVRFLKLREVR